MNVRRGPKAKKKGRTKVNLLKSLLQIMQKLNWKSSSERLLYYINALIMSFFKTRINYTT